MATECHRCDVAVVGGGLGGLAASIHLRKAGLDVTCIEPDRFPHDRVGESLDWSAPGLLKRMGLDVEDLIRDRFATYKRNIEVVTTERPSYTAEPFQWFEKSPLRFTTVTMHVDRVELDKRLFEIAKGLGVEFVWERASRVETDGDRVAAVETANGSRIEADWFIDSSGRRARLFARKFEIPKIDYGPKKVSMWTYFETTPHNEGTTFYVDSWEDTYTVWIWEIPITPERISVGIVLPADALRDQRRQGRTPREVLESRLGVFEYFRELMADQPDVPVRTTAYQSYVYENACGPNWLIVGEAASLPDPMTANGVTAACRHAEEGARFLQDSVEAGEFSRRQRRVYNTNLKRMGHAFNHSIETSIYDWPIRWGLGPMPAQKIYTTFSYTVNALYSRFNRNGIKSWLFFGIIVFGVRLWMNSWWCVGRVGHAIRGLLGRQRGIGSSQAGHDDRGTKSAGQAA